MNIFEDDEIFIFGTARADTIVASGQAGGYSLYGLNWFGMEIMGGRGNDDINPGIMQHRDSLTFTFGGNNAHDARQPERFNIPTPPANSGDDTMHVGQGIWADGEDGNDRFFNHGPSFRGDFAPRIWIDWQKDDVVFDNTDRSKDMKVGPTIDGTDFRADGSGVYLGFQVTNITFARHFTSEAGITYAEVNGATLESYSKVPAIRQQITEMRFYDKGDDPDHSELFVRVDAGETPRQAVSEFLHEHALAGATDQWGGDQFLF